MLYSIRHNFLFVHIPKTGGTSLRSALNPLRWSDPWYYPMWFCHRLSHLTNHRIASKLPRHCKIITAQEMLPPPVFDKLFKFAVIRNPWDLQVSSYHHLQREHPQLLHEIHDFESFIRYKLSNDRPRNWLLDISITPQSDYLTDLRGNLLVNDFGRYESLNEDYHRILKRIGLKKIPPLPHKRKGNRQPDYRTYYSDELAESIAQHYQDDLKRFGYSFD